jgi:hypothetical protein
MEQEEGIKNQDEKKSEDKVESKGWTGTAIQLKD